MNKYKGLEEMLDQILKDGSNVERLNLVLNKMEEILADNVSKRNEKMEKLWEEKDD